MLIKSDNNFYIQLIFTTNNRRWPSGSQAVTRGYPFKIFVYVQICISNESSLHKQSFWLWIKTNRGQPPGQKTVSRG